MHIFVFIFFMFIILFYFISNELGGVIKNYHSCYPDRLVKAFVQPKYAIKMGNNPHYFTFINNYYSVNELYQKTNNESSDHIDSKNISLYHYSLKSYEDYKLKLNRWGKLRIFFFNYDKKTYYKNNLSIERFDLMNKLMTKNCSIPTIIPQLGY